MSDMKYFKDDNNNVFAYNIDGSEDHLIHDGLTSIDRETAMKIANPPPSQSELVAQADAHKAQLAAAVEQSIRPLERAKQLGIATDEELAALTEWERYSVFLMRVDTSKAPDIDWPDVPTV